MIAGPGTGAAQVSGDDGSKLQEPATNGLVGDVQTSFGDHLLNIAETQSEPAIQPDRMADNFRWKAVTFERELTHRLSLMSVAHPHQPSLCDNALARAESLGLPWAPSYLTGIATPHSAHVAGQSDLGYTSYCRRTSKAGD